MTLAIVALRGQSWASRAETIPASRSEVPALTLRVPSTWRRTGSEPGTLRFAHPGGRTVSVHTFSQRTKDETERSASHSVLVAIAESRERLPETVKEWTAGGARYAVYVFASRRTRADRPVSSLSLTVWNEKYVAHGHLMLPSVADVLEAQEWELVARSIRLPT